MTGKISYHREVKRLSNWIRDIVFTDIAGNETRGMYRYDPSSVDHVIGERQGFLSLSNPQIVQSDRQDKRIFDSQHGTILQKV